MSSVFSSLEEAPELEILRLWMPVPDYATCPWCLQHLRWHFRERSWLQHPDEASTIYTCDDRQFKSSGKYNIKLSNTCSKHIGNSNRQCETTVIPNPTYSTANFTQKMANLPPGFHDWPHAILCWVCCRQGTSALQGWELVRETSFLFFTLPTP